ncbi:MAG: RsmB/NOP family class I SAM-dependent RNA methyltransferase [Alphaproteobacteria bacterium]
MQRPAQYMAVMELFDSLAQNATPADRLVAAYFRGNRYIGSKDKGFISTHLYRILRTYYTLGAALDACHLPVSGRSLVLAQAVRDNEVMDEIFTDAEYQPKRLSENEKKMARHIPEHLKKAAEGAVKWEVPEWIVPLLQRAFGADAEAAAMAWQAEAPLDVRANTLKTTRETVLQALEATGHRVSPTPHSPLGVRLAKRAALHELQTFKDGWFEVQDEGSQLLAAFTGVKPGQRVVDFCAGAGGKTLAMAAMMQNKGQIMACDVIEEKLEETRKRLKRAGVGNAQTHLIARELDKWQKSQANLADVVLVDAPCSGTGTWRRNPDAKFRFSAEKLAELQTIQRDILGRAALLVKAGGKLIYATCSVFLEENDDQAANFSAQNPTWQQGDVLRVAPHTHNTDGFYAVTFIKPK